LKPGSGIDEKVAMPATETSRPAGDVFLRKQESRGAEEHARPVKLVIQIPCYNEEQSLPVTLSHLPRSVQGIDVVEWLIIDDGSTDRTLEIARQHGVDHIVRLPHNQGLACAFMAGLRACLAAGADVIVNTDADNQYNADDIPSLVAPILQGRAEIVVGCRPIDDIAHFSAFKKLLQKVGSWVVRVASKTDIPDAPSGFRAMHRNAASQLNVFSEYTYTLETIIQAGQKHMAITWVPVRVNGYLRPSRLIRSIPRYVWRSLVTILRIFIVYRPLAFFMTLSAVVMAPGILAVLRFLYLYSIGQGAGHVQSLVLGSSLVVLGFIIVVVGIVSDLIAVNRKLLEDLRARELLDRTETKHG
jgi:glycosyltransferase involved in cell wall biosynthesis